VNHVHLVVVPELVGHVRPGFRRKARLAIERCFEPSNPGKEFGPHPHLLNKSPLKLAGAQPRAVG
jgi:hypothetical protein